MTDTQLALQAIDEAFKAHVQKLCTVLNSEGLQSSGIDRAKAGYKIAVQVREAMRAMVEGA